MKLTPQDREQIRNQARDARNAGRDFDLAAWVDRGFAEASVRYHRDKGYELATGARETVNTSRNGDGSR